MASFSSLVRWEFSNQIFEIQYKASMFVVTSLSSILYSSIGTKKPHNRGSNGVVFTQRWDCSLPLFYGLIYFVKKIYNITGSALQLTQLLHNYNMSVIQTSILRLWITVVSGDNLNPYHLPHTRLVYQLNSCVGRSEHCYCPVFTVSKKSLSYFHTG